MRYAKHLDVADQRAITCLKGDVMEVGKCRKDKLDDALHYRHRERVSVS